MCIPTFAWSNLVFENWFNVLNSYKNTVPRYVWWVFFFLFDINAKSVRVAALTVVLISTPLPWAASFNLKPL